jgi:membrane protease YdiL (CAAX protease family)
MSTSTPPEPAEEVGAGPGEPSGEPPPQLPEQGPAPEARLWLEVGVVLALAWVPDVFYAVASLCWGTDTSRPPVYGALYLLVRSLQVSAPVLYIIWRSDEGWSHFGLVKPWWPVDGLLGLAICLAGRFAYYGCWSLTAPMWADDNHDTTVPAPWPFEVVAQIANGFAEELVLRGFLLVRLERLCGSPVRAVALTSVLFAAYHAYQGPWGVVHAFLLGVVYGTAFCWLRRLWPLAVAHTLSGIFTMVGMRE